MEPKYYNLWHTRYNQWTSGFRTLPTNLREFQNPRFPWKLTLPEIVTWLKNDWGAEAVLSDSATIEECNNFLVYIRLIVKELDPNYDYDNLKKREEHALKFL